MCNRNNYHKNHQLVTWCPLAYSICDWILENWSESHIYEFEKQIFNSIYLRNKRGCFHATLHKCTVIQVISVYQLLNKKLPELPTILDRFLPLP